MLTREEIKNLAVKYGFKLKEQPDGSMDLHPYVYDFAFALENKAEEEMRAIYNSR